MRADELSSVPREINSAASSSREIYILNANADSRELEMTQLFLACRVKEQMAQIHDVHAGLLGHDAKHPRSQRKAIIYARAVQNGHLEKSTN
jgi:hypothetical protein